MAHLKTPQWLIPTQRTPRKALAQLEPDHARSYFDRDYGIICHSSKFRRLSRKTQVFLAPKSDFPRTRLTHSIEVAQLGRQLATIFRQEFEKAYSAFTLGEAGEFERLVECACLAHDLGHPPFGHKGSKTLERLCKTLGYEFDDNKHNVHYFLSSEDALNVTDVLLDATIKYKSDADEKTPAHCYVEHKDRCEEIFNALGTYSFRHPAAYLMEVADDIVNFTSDLEDARKLNILTNESLASPNSLKFVFDYLKIQPGEEGDEKKDSSDLMKALVAVYHKQVSEMFSNLQIAGSVDANELPMKMAMWVTKHSAEKQSENKEKLSLLSIPYLKNGEPLSSSLKRLYFDKRIGIVTHQSVKQPELYADKVIAGLWEALSGIVSAAAPYDAPAFWILPKEKQKWVKENIAALKHDKVKMAQALSRYIAGMTDDYCLEMYARLHRPADISFKDTLSV